MNLKNRAQTYPRNLGEKLGLDRVKERLQDICDSILGKLEVSKMEIYAERETVSTLLTQAEEFTRLIQSQDYESVPTDFELIKESIERLKLNGAVLSEEQFLKMAQFLRQLNHLLKIFKKHREDFPKLYELSDVYGYEKIILVSIDAVFDSKGQIRPEVSPELNKVRLEIKKALSIQDQRFEGILKKCRQDKWLSEEEQTIRNGRRVLAVLSEHKRKLKGIIHDESSTGKSMFIEPQSLVELGNDLFELRQKEKKEILRILAELSDEVRPYTEELALYQKLAGKFDFTKAKAKLSIQLNAIVPSFSTNNELYLQSAYHPLLKLSFGEQKREVIPLEVELSPKRRILIISGPNAGGKSICLKTIGLLQVMFQSGLPIPCEKRSTLPVFKRLFLDMGDDQSLDNDLSTYSSHLKALKHFANFSDGETLFLLDEFGTGTDPQFGGAIAEAVLEHLVLKDAYGVATTHYSNLKLFAETRTGMANASMMFDQEKMVPTYVLQVGKPGSSYAFEIANRIGLNKTILKYAKDRLGKEAGSYEELVNKLEQEKVVLERKLSQARDKENKYQQLSVEYKEMKTELKENKQRMALEYKTQLQNELKNYNKKFERALADLKKPKKDQGDVAKELRARLKKDTDRVIKEVEGLKEKVVYSKQEEVSFKEGDSVKMIEGTEIGVIESLDKKKAIVVFDHLRSVIPIKDLQKAKSKDKKKVSRGVDITDYVMEFTSSIDVRGQRAHEALKAVSDLIDQAIIVNQSQVRVVHGRGDGILKQQIAGLLKETGHVTDFEFEHPERGGDGVTIINL